MMNEINLGTLHIHDGIGTTSILRTAYLPTSIPTILILLPVHQVSLKVCKVPYRTVIDINHVLSNTNTNTNTLRAP